MIRFFKNFILLFLLWFILFLLYRFPGERHEVSKWVTTYSVWDARSVGVLAMAKRWYIDGTFHIIRKPFYQLLTMHCFVKKDSVSKQVRLVYAMMSRKERNDYVAVQGKQRSFISTTECQGSHAWLWDGHLESNGRCIFKKYNENLRTKVLYLQNHGDSLTTLLQLTNNLKKW